MFSTVYCSCETDRRQQKEIKTTDYSVVQVCRMCSAEVVDYHFSFLFLVLDLTRDEAVDLLKKCIDEVS